MSEKNIIEKNDLILAMQDCKTAKDLSKRFNTSLSTIKRRLKEYNLSTFSKLFTDDDFLKLYDQGLTDSEISRRLNVSVSTVNDFRRSKKLEKNFKYKNEEYSYNILNLYKNNFSIKEIAYKLNLDTRLVEWTVCRENIDKNYVLNDEEYQVFIGSLLGDGCISKGKFTSRLCFAHSEKQKEYAIWKSGILKNIMMLYSPFQKQVRFDKRTQKEYTSYYCWTKYLTYLNKYRNKWYINGIKRIVKEDLYKLNALGLAIWFQDDGYQHKSGYYLSTMCFPYEDILIIKEYFQDIWDIEVIIQKNNEIYIPAKYRDKFTRIIKPYIHDDCKYKLIESL